MNDPTEAARIAMLPHLPGDLTAAIEGGEPVWDTDGLQENFTVVGFAAPLVVVRRKSDGAVGSLKFTSSPRYYFDWIEDN